MTRHEHRLIGCRPEPLASYLKALGVLRLVAEQADSGATGHWEADGFVLRTTLDDQGLDRFFLWEYQPSPIISPWNNSSGFGPEGAGELHAIEASQDPRLGPYRKAIAVGRQLMTESGSQSWAKERMLQESRSRLPDGCLPWLDAAAVLTDGRPVYPPLLGTGGNDGRLEFSRNFHQRVLDVLGLSGRRDRHQPAWLTDALFDIGRSTGLRGSSPGQFDPGAAGGANSAATGAATAVLNPWDWVLLLEGSLLLASGSARRLASSSGGRAAAPFTVDSTAGGYASASDVETSRGELWAPLWGRPAGLPELRSLFAEARADWRGGHVSSGLDLAKAAASLGVDRGIASFSRHAFVERFGLSTVAVPVGRVAVSNRPAVVPLAQLDSWLDRVRRASNPPAAVIQALRAVDQTSFELTSEGRPDQLLRVLVETARLERAVGHSPSFRERALLRPLSGLDSRSWLAVIDLEAEQPEVRVAACLASLRDVTTSSGPGLLRLLLRPVRVINGGRVEWTERPATVGGLGRRPLPPVLADALARRAVQWGQQARSMGSNERPGSSFHALTGLVAPVSDLADLVSGQLDEVRLGEVFSAFLLLDWRDGSELSWRPWTAVPPAFAVVGPFFAPPGESAPSTGWRQLLNTTPLVPESHWPGALAAGRLQPVLESALRRLRIAGLQPVPVDAGLMAAGQPPTAAHRLAAALLCRLSYSSRRQLLEQACPDPDLPQDVDAHGQPTSDIPTTEGEESAKA